MNARLFHIALFCSLFLSAPAVAERPVRRTLTPQERNGKRIYLRGESSSGHPVDAWLGNPPMRVSAKMLPCMNCHGLDGKGRPEGGVFPSNLNWSVLTKRYGLTHPSGRRHRAYDEKSLKRAITRGIDPSGNKIGSGMPHYGMADSDLDDLIAYLKRIEEDRDPGITQTHITVATVLPLEGPLEAAGTAVRDVLGALVKDINETGGVYNRSIDLRVVPAGPTPAESVARLKTALETGGVFAIVAPCIPEAESSLAELAADREIPVIGSLGTPPDRPDGPNRYLFYVLSGLPVQARALVDHCAAERPSGASPRAALLARAGRPYEELTRPIETQCRSRGIPLSLVASYAPETFAPEALAERLDGVEDLFFIGPSADCAALLREVAARGHAPRVFQLGSFLGPEILDCPPAFQGRLTVAFPNCGTPQTEQALRAFHAFLKRHGIRARQSSVLLSAYCAGKLLIESLKDAGHAPRREQVIRELEGLYKHETGLTPPLTFGPNRRVGAYGAYVVSIDLDAKSLVCDNRWIEPSE